MLPVSKIIILSSLLKISQLEVHLSSSGTTMKKSEQLFILD